MGATEGSTGAIGALGEPQGTSRALEWLQRGFNGSSQAVFRPKRANDRLRVRVVPDYISGYAAPDWLVTAITARNSTNKRRKELYRSVWYWVHNMYNSCRVN